MPREIPGILNIYADREPIARGAHSNREPVQNPKPRHFKPFELFDHTGRKKMLVCENPKVSSAKWVNVKEYDSKPYPFSIALVGEWIANSVIIVPFSSFPCEKRNI